MAELPIPHRVGRARPHLNARLIATQVRRGHELARLLGTRQDEETEVECHRWHERNEQVLRFLIDSDEVRESYLRLVYQRMCSRRALSRPDVGEDVEAELRDLVSVEGELGLSELGREPHPAAPVTGEPRLVGRVLLVYGRNQEAKEKVARYLMKVGFEPILLDEQAAHGRTLIEKLEALDPVFAVVLLTGDDVGALASEPKRLRPRARQNVIFELGFSVARLTRERVCVLYERGVELPSDFQGVEYQPLDAAGAWKAKLARELYGAGLRFDPVNAL